MPRTELSIPIYVPSKDFNLDQLGLPHNCHWYESEPGTRIYQLLDKDKKPAGWVAYIIVHGERNRG